jgi:hypothetical protein
MAATTVPRWEEEEEEEKEEGSVVEYSRERVSLGYLFLLNCVHSLLRGLGH